MKKKVLAIILFLAMILTAAALTSCGSEKEPEEVVTLKVGMIGRDIKTAYVIIAKELGYFEEAGVNVEFEKVNSLLDGLTAVSMDKLDLLPYGVIPSCSFISQGTDVVIFCEKPD